MNPKTSVKGIVDAITPEVGGVSTRAIFASVNGHAQAMIAAVAPMVVPARVLVRS